MGRMGSLNHLTTRAPLTNKHNNSMWHSLRKLTYDMGPKVFVNTGNRSDKLLTVESTRAKGPCFSSPACSWLWSLFKSSQKPWYISAFQFDAWNGDRDKMLEFVLPRNPGLGSVHMTLFLRNLQYAKDFGFKGHLNPFAVHVGQLFNLSVHHINNR